MAETVKDLEKKEASAHKRLLAAAEKADAAAHVLTQAAREHAVARTVLCNARAAVGGNGAARAKVVAP